MRTQLPPFWQNKLDFTNETNERLLERPALKAASSPETGRAEPGGARHDQWLNRQPRRIGLETDPADDHINGGRTTFVSCANGIR
jgi:hypothetical protein